MIHTHEKAEEEYSLRLSSGLLAFPGSTCCRGDPEFLRVIPTNSAVHGFMSSRGPAEMPKEVPASSSEETVAVRIWGLAVCQVL